MSSSLFYQGPLPHPDILKGYAELDATLPDRIVRMAETEMASRHAAQTQALSHSFTLAKLGMYSGLAVALAGLGAASYMAQFSAVAAAVIGAVDLGVLVGIFVAGRPSKREESEEAQEPK